MSEDTGRQSSPHGLPIMSLRDYFAGQVLPSVVLAYALPTGRLVIGSEQFARDVTGIAYYVADAMLMERAK